MTFKTQHTRYSTPDSSGIHASAPSLRRQFARGAGVALLICGLTACNITLSGGPMSPLPDASASPVQNQFAYALPLSLKAQTECGEADYLRYELSADGVLKFLTAELSFGESPQASDYQKRQLTDAELAKIQETLAAANLGDYHARAKAIPADAPRTLECRTLAVMTLQVNGETQNYTQNGRAFDYPKGYREAFEQIETQLHNYAKPIIDTQLSYSLPFKLSIKGECQMPEYTRYEIDNTGTFSWALENVATFAPGNPPMESRQLNSTEQQDLLELLNQKNLLPRMQAADKVSADAPQTEECRSIDVYHFQHSAGQTQIEGAQTRMFNYSEDILNDLSELQAQLKALTKT